MVCPLPLMSKGESDWLLLPSSPKGEIVGIMIHMLYSMATHSSQMINYSAAKLFSGSAGLLHKRCEPKVHGLSCREKFTHFHAEKISRTFMQRKVPFMQRKVHALSCREKFLSCKEKFTHFHAEKSVRTFMQRKAHAHGKSYGWFMALV